MAVLSVETAGHRLDSFLVNGAQEFFKGQLVGFEFLVPNGRRSISVHNLQNPVVPAAAVYLDLYGVAVFLEFSAERGFDNIVFSHSALLPASAFAMEDRIVAGIREGNQLDS